MIDGRSAEGPVLAERLYVSYSGFIVGAKQCIIRYELLTSKC